MAKKNKKKKVEQQIRLEKVKAESLKWVAIATWANAASPIFLTLKDVVEHFLHKK